MTKISQAVQPKTELGNDANDNRDNIGYLQQMHPKPIDLDHDALTKTTPDTEDDIALKFSSIHRDHLRYTAAWGKWLIWNGRVWQHDSNLAVYDMVRTHCRELLKDENQLRLKMLNAGTIAAIERLIRSDRYHAASTEQWDTNNWLLNTPLGIVDLNTGILHQHDPSKHCTKITSTGPQGSCPAWERFISEITGNDVELAQFIQRVIGYACTGSIKEHALFFFYGTGANGKGTLLNTISNILNDYTVIASADVFTESTHDRHPTELAALMGARLVVAQETDEGRKWAESKLKTLTGGDPITARYMRQDFFTFLPKFTLIIAGNHKPSITTVDEAIRRRLHLVPFNITIPRADRDTDLAEKLQAEASGIMQWMMDGVIDYNNQGLHPPQSVLEATEGYFEDENTLEQWIADCCETAPEYWETPRILFNSWKDFTKAANLSPGNEKDFKSKMEASGYRYSRTGKRGRHYQGIKVNSVFMKPNHGRGDTSDTISHIYVYAYARAYTSIRENVSPRVTPL